MPSRLALVTGASGAIGSRLTARLLTDGWSVRVVSRDASRLDGFPWSDDVEVVEGDASAADVLERAAEGVDVAWFLIHSMSGTYDYAEEDLRIAQAFGAACHTAGVSRIVYLGGLLPERDLSEHLGSRQEVGQALIDSGVPTAVLQAGIVVGPGSVSYELLRRAAALPVVVAPSWVNHSVQPISLADALHYLVGAADLPAQVSRTFDIGGADTLTYRELIGAFAEAVGRRRPPVITVPVLLPFTTAFAAGVVAPAPTSLVSSLVESLQVDMVCREHDIAEHVPDPAGGLTDFRTAVVEAGRE